MSEEPQHYEHLKRIIEALLFAANTPLSFLKIREVISHSHELKPKVLRQMIQELQHEYIAQQRAFRLEEVAQGYTLKACAEYRAYIDLLYRDKRGEKLSPASAEVLAIIAYKQPITRSQVDAIRGVDSSGPIGNLLERQLIVAMGKSSSPGRPTLYGITKEFLHYFGLRDLNELPPLPA